MRDNLDVKEWIRFAQMDYDTAKNMAILHNPKPLEIICYHCQQSAEKILKAYVITKNEPLKRVHDLTTLLEQCVMHDTEFNGLVDVCTSLTDYAIATKYPYFEPEITEQDMKTALKDAEKILEFTKEKLNG